MCVRTVCFKSPTNQNHSKKGCQWDISLQKNIVWIGKYLHVLFHRQNYTREALACTVQSRLCGWSYLIKFSIGNLSYSPCSEPSHTVLLPDVLYKMYARHAPVLIQFTPLGASYYYFSNAPCYNQPMRGDLAIGGEQDNPYITPNQNQAFKNSQRQGTFV